MNRPIEIGLVLGGFAAILAVMAEQPRFIANHADEGLFAFAIAFGVAAGILILVGVTSSLQGKRDQPPE